MLKEIFGEDPNSALWQKSLGELKKALTGRLPRIAQDDFIDPYLTGLTEDNSIAFSALHLGNWLTDVSQIIDPVALDGLYQTSLDALQLPWEQTADETNNSTDSGSVTDASNRSSAGEPATESVKQILVELFDRTLSSMVAKVFPKDYQTITGEAASEAARAKYVSYEQVLEAMRTAKMRIQGVTQEELRSAGHQITQLIEEQRDSIAELISLILLDSEDGNREQSIRRETNLWIMLRGLLRMKGYFKFAHKGKKRKPPMQPDVYFHIFDEFLGGKATEVDEPVVPQYYPYPHLDRPEILSIKPRFRCHLSPEENLDPQALKLDEPFFAETVNGHCPQHEKTPTLFDYLRDQLAVTAGLLSEIDLNFASDPNTYEKKRHRSKNWYLQFARLGHALHAVEDYFAHSNFVEHCINQIGSESMTSSPTYRDRVDHLLEKLHRRTRRGHPTTPTNDFEPHIVTGTFDTLDFVVALIQIGENMLGPDPDHPYELVDRSVRLMGELIQDSVRILNGTLELDDGDELLKTQLDEYRKKLKELKQLSSRYAQDQSKLRGESDKEKIVNVIEELRYILVDQRLSYSILKELTKEEQVDREALNYFADLLVLLLQYQATERLVLNYYECFVSLNEFFVNPLSWIVAKIKEVLGEKVVEIFLKYVKWETQHLIESHVHGIFGGDRVGSHSLLAKDIGAVVLFKEARDCAKVAHWYIMKTMFRWHDRSKRESIEDNWVDWQELLDFLVENPNAVSDERQIMTIEPRIHIAGEVFDPLTGKSQGESLESLARRYRVTACDADGVPMGGRFTWRNIASETLNVEQNESNLLDIVNAILEPQGGQLVPTVRGPKYAFPTGFPVKIPNQCNRVSTGVLGQFSDRWYRRVLLDDSSEVLDSFHYDDGLKFETGEEVNQSRQSRIVESQILHRHRIVSRQEVIQIIQKGLNLKYNFRKEYVPSSR